MKISDIMKTAAFVLMLAASTPAAEAAAVATLRAPYGLAVDQTTGSLYIADASAGQIDVYNPVTNVISSFAKVASPFALAVNANGIGYAGTVGSTGQISVYNALGQSINTLPCTRRLSFYHDVRREQYSLRSDRPLPRRRRNFSAYGGDLALPYQALASYASPPSSHLYLQRNTCTAAREGDSFALAYDNGQVFMLLNRPLNVYDEQTLLSGHANDYFSALESATYLIPQASAALPAWQSNHLIATGSQAFAATVDASHNIFYTDPTDKDIAVTGKGYLNGTGRRRHSH